MSRAYVIDTRCALAHLLLPVLQRMTPHFLACLLWARWLPAVNFCFSQMHCVKWMNGVWVCVQKAIPHRVHQHNTLPVNILSGQILYCKWDAMRALGVWTPRIVMRAEWFVSVFGEPRTGSSCSMRYLSEEPRRIYICIYIMAREQGRKTFQHRSKK